MLKNGVYVVKNERSKIDINNRSKFEAQIDAVFRLTALTVRPRGIGTG